MTHSTKDILNLEVFNMSNTLKGALIIGQSGGPTSVINASAYGVIRTALDCPDITAVYGAAHGIKGVLNDKLYDMGQEDAKELELLLNTPSSELGDFQKVRCALLLLQRRQRLHGHLQQGLQVYAEGGL